MASIRQRGDVFQARVIRKGHPPYAKTFPTRDAAQTWAQGLEAMLSLGTGTAPAVFRAPVDSAVFRLSDALDRYAQDVTATKRGASQEVRRLRALRSTNLAPRCIKQLRAADFAQYRDRRLESVGPNTVRLELALLSHVYEIARREWGYEALQNPLKLIRKPILPRGRARRITDEELATLRAYCSPKFGNLLTFAVETGMRRGEIAALTWADVDPNRRTATLVLTKNGEERVVPLSSRALAALGNLAVPVALKDGRIFGLQTADAITQAFNRACRAAGVRGARFHDLRHEAVSRLFERGLTLPEVAAISGHKTWAMLRRYTHLAPERLADKLG